MFTPICISGWPKLDISELMKSLANKGKKPEIPGKTLDKVTVVFVHFEVFSFLLT